MKEAGLLSADCLNDFPIPLASESTEVHVEVMRNFERELKLVGKKIVTGNFSIYQQYQDTGDLEAYAKAFTGFSRGYLYPYLKGMCRGEEGEALIQLFFARVEDSIRSQPDPIGVTQCYYHLTKV